MKKIILLPLFVLCFVSANAQVFGNEWINYNQPYYAIKVAQESVYRLTYADLANAGLPLMGGTVNPQNIQLFWRGKEQFIYVQGEGDGVFNQTDYIDFYGKPNNGDLDSVFYSSANRSHNYTSFYTDTATYYLTYGSVAGKRIVATSGNTLSGSPEPFYLHEALSVYTNEFYRGAPFASNDSRFLLSEFSDGEGWYSSRQNKGATLTAILQTPNLVTTANAPAPKLKMLSYGVSNGTINGSNPPQYPPFNHHIRLDVGSDLTTSMRNVLDTLFNSYTRVYNDQMLQTTDLGATTNVQFKVINDINVGADGNALSYLSITYPRSFDVAGDSLRFLNFKNTGSAAQLKFTNFNYSTPLIYDFTNNQRIIGVLNAGDFSVMINPNAATKRICLVDEAKIKRIATPIQTVVFNNFQPATSSYNYIIITSDKLLSSANDYASYRQSLAGGGYNVLIATTEQLYDQFYYGVKNHPIALRHFLNYMATQQPTPIQDVLLLGKGYIYKDLYKNAANSATRYRDNLVPTYGDPASDNLITKGVLNSQYAPAFSIGRIAARTNTDVQNYLSKVVAYENAPDGEWKKNVFQASGGVNQSEQIDFKRYLDSYAAIMEGKKMGATTSLFEKTVTAPIITNPTELLISKANEGLLFYNFFGHGAASNLAVEPGSPDRYNNSGKYPLMYFSGCNVGNAFDSYSLGEDFTLSYPNKGAIGWIAGTNIGSPPYLNAMATTFIKNMSDSLYGEPLGRIFRQSLEQITTIDNYEKMHVQQLLLQADPAVRLYNYSKPDYTIKSDGFFITPDNVTALSDSFTVGIVVRNLGRASADSISIKLKRTLPNGATSFLENRRIKAPSYIDTVYYTIKSKDIATRGLNRFEATADALNNVTETNEINNTSYWDYLIRSNSVNVLYPEAFAITPNTNVDLVFENSNLFAINKDYVVELDTTQKFNSAYKQSFSVNSPTALVRVSVSVLPQDSVVYYWRAKINAPDSLGGVWDGRSFTHFSGSPIGWNQTKYAQYQPNIQTTEVVMDTTTRRLEFQPNTKIFTVRCDGFFASPPSSAIDPGMRLDRVLTNGGYPCEALLDVTIIDGTTLKPLSVLNCNGNGSQTNVHRIFINTSAGRLSLKQLIDTTATGNYVGILTRSTGAHFLKLDGLLTSLATLGADTLKIKRAGTGPVGSVTSMAFIGKKNAPSFAAVTDTTLSLNAAKDSASIAAVGIVGKWYKGSITSDKIGPASKWKQSSIALNIEAPAANDLVTYDIIGIRANGSDSIIVQNSAQSTTNLQNIVAASSFPYLRLRANFLDTITRTAPQLRRWTVLYDGIPEGTILIDQSYTFYKNPIDEGDTAKISLKYTNISPFVMDSILVRYGVSRTGYSQIINKKIQPLQPNQTAVLNLSMPTRNLTEKSQFNVFVNPNFAQPELLLSNNFVTVRFDVRTDAIKPLLDVVFDGRHIFNNDIVSPNPVIMATLKDENRFLQNLDTANFTVKLKKPNSPDFTPIYFGGSDSRLVLLPRGSDGKAKINFTPQNLPNGDYELWVNATDERGNRAGTEPYQIGFKVINESGISNFYPYPNPFSTKMRFVFTLTGSEMPDYAKIQIFTPSGKMVREITQDELGNMFIGNNVSDFSWDGTDQFGDRLANGVYFYKVDIRKNGEPMPLRETTGDKYFKERLGKIYIIK